MTTRWSDPQVTMARPPSKPRMYIDWLNVIVWLVIPIIFWGLLLVLLFGRPW